MASIDARLSPVPGDLIFHSIQDEERPEHSRCLLEFQITLLGKEMEAGGNKVAVWRYAIHEISLCDLDAGGKYRQRELKGGQFNAALRFLSDRCPGALAKAARDVAWGCSLNDNLTDTLFLLTASAPAGPALLAASRADDIDFEPVRADLTGSAILGAMALFRAISRIGNMALSLIGRFRRNPEAR